MKSAQDYNEKDLHLQNIFEEISAGHPDFWSFRGNSNRRNGHAFFHYPAMMVPKMQDVLLESVLKVDPAITNVFDPFVGSGTMMLEAMMKGLDFFGQDINPLAVLLCKTKSGTMDVKTLERDVIDLKLKISSDNNTSIDVEFVGLEKWFRQDIAEDLSKIRRAILTISKTWRRRFFWIALAETVRLTSNSRTSNFKLYTYPESTIISREIYPVNTFFEVTERNLKEFHKQRKYLSDKGFLEGNQYKGHIEIELGDTIKIRGKNNKKLLITSPPYGDNSTTVTYGQFSYLPLQWIQLDDIDKKVDSSYLVTSQAIDSISLGGSKASAINRAEALLNISPSFARVIEELKEEPPDRIKRVASFFSDFELTINPILSQLEPNAYTIWIVGNRSVGNRQIPMNKILRETLENKQLQFVCELQRKFPRFSKRMGNLTNTMPTEQILIMRMAT